MFVFIRAEGIDPGTGSDLLEVGSAMRGQWIPTISRVINRTMLHLSVPVLPTVTQHADCSLLCSAQVCPSVISHFRVSESGLVESHGPAAAAQSMCVLHTFTGRCFRHVSRCWWHNMG